jgi:hypothetical protein
MDYGRILLDFSTNFGDPGILSYLGGKKTVLVLSGRQE